jgi:hypothetical protein
VSTEKTFSEALRVRISEIRKELEELDFLVNGTLLSRTKTCGKPTCRCATDPDARHGPYYEWTRMKDGRLAHTTVSPEQATILTHAISNDRKLQELVRRWHELSEDEILKMGQSAQSRNAKKRR